MLETPKSVILLGASGTIGSATLAALLQQGYAVSCLMRPGRTAALPEGVRQQEVDFTDPAQVAAAFRQSNAQAVISCMASRTGSKADAWAVDYHSQRHALAAAKEAGIGQFVLLSAICVQKPFLEFQRAKLAFEAELQASGLRWSIVRPTAFFKSLSGQVKRVQAGKPFLLFGDGELTACTPISDRDLARYIVGCLHDSARWEQILPIGGPGPAMTPRAQGEMLFEMLGKQARFRHVPVALMDAIIATLGVFGKLSPNLAAKAEFARIGRYYATESMLVWDAHAGCYDASATPAFGSDTLRDHYAQMISGAREADLGAHAFF